jgi:hypothetical protein
VSARVKLGKDGRGKLPSTCAISGLCRGIKHVFALPGCYTSLIARLSTFRDSLLVPYSTLKGTDRLFRNFGNYQSKLGNIPKERIPSKCFINMHLEVNEQEHLGGDLKFSQRNW